MSGIYGPYRALIRDWHDGDTCHTDIDLGFGIILSAYDLDGKPILSCRALGINAPELSAPGGEIARDYASHLCPPGTRLLIASHGWDKYGGRFDGTMRLPDGTDFSSQMIAAGHAVPFMTKG